MLNLFTSPDGKVECLYSDELETVKDIGRLHTERWSEIEINNETQEWEVRLKEEGNRVAFSHIHRDKCIEWEKDYYHRQRAALGIPS
jgi:hypothetical protein